MLWRWRSHLKCWVDIRVDRDNGCQEEYIACVVTKMKYIQSKNEQIVGTLNKKYMSCIIDVNYVDYAVGTEGE